MAAKQRMCATCAVFDDKSIDAVTIAMPNHWHSLAAIWALQAGKDVFVEKPISHNVNEGRRLVEAANKYNKQVCQVGTQGRSLPGAQQTIEFMRNGGIGEIKLARGLCYNRRDSIGSKGVFEVPAGIDYNLWCGPAPMNPPTRNNKQNGPVHYEWHWFWDYGNGDLGNQGIHQMDMARWGLGVNELAQAVVSYGGRFGYEDAAETPNTQIVVFDYGPKTLIFEVRGLPSVNFKNTDVGVVFEGTNGYAVVPKNYRGAAARPSIRTGSWSRNSPAKATIFRGSSTLCAREKGRYRRARLGRPLKQCLVSPRQYQLPTGHEDDQCTNCSAIASR